MLNLSTAYIFYLRNLEIANNVLNNIHIAKVSLAIFGYLYVCTMYTYVKNIMIYF